MPRYLSGGRDRFEVGTSLVPAGSGVHDGFQAPDSGAQLVDLRAVFNTLGRHLRIIMGLTLLATVAAGYFARKQVPMYRSTAVIRLEDTRRAMTGGLVSSAGDALDPRSVDPILSQLEVLTSRKVAGRVVDSLPRLRIDAHGFTYDVLEHLAVTTPDPIDSVRLTFTDTGVRAQAGQEQVEAAYGALLRIAGIEFAVRGPRRFRNGIIVARSRESSIERLIDDLKVKSRERTDVVDVVYTARDPGLAQQVVNRVVQTFRQVDAETAQQQSRIRREFVEEQLRSNDSLLIRAQEALSAFRSNQQVYSSKDKLTADQTALTSIDLKRQELEGDLRLYRSVLSTIEQPGSGDDALGTLMVSPSVSTNPVLTQLYTRFTGLRTSRDSMTAGPWGSSESNPDVKRVDLLIRNTREKLVDAVRSLVASTESRIRGVDVVKSQSAVAFRDVSGKEAGEAKLVQQSEALHSMSNQLREEYQRARIAEAVEVGRVEIVDLATNAKRNLGVGPLRVTLFGTMLGFVIGCLIALVLEQLNTSIRRREQIRSSLQVPELAVIPQVAFRPRRRIGSGHKRTNGTQPQLDALRQGLVAAGDLQSSGAEAYRLLRTNLLFANPTDPPRTVLVTSPAPGDGKTTVAANLAITFAQQGMRVLLMDCDLRRGRLHSVLKVPREPGASQVLRGQVPTAEAILQTSVEHLFIMPMGTVPRTPAELLGSAVMRELLQQLVTEFQIIVMDAPPVLAAADSSILASLADATILVLRAGHTDEEEAQQALHRLGSVGARVVGAVLNDQDSTVQRYGGYYYSGYYGADEPG